MILLVEDNEDEVDLILRAFKKSNIVNKVVILRDGAEALEYLFGPPPAGKETNELPTVVVLDLKLPKINGFEVLERIRREETTQLLPVVILTSSNEEQDIIKSYKGGANSYVRKPIDFEQFSKAVIDLGLYWHILNEPPPLH